MRSHMQREGLYGKCSNLATFRLNSGSNVSSHSALLTFNGTKTYFNPSRVCLTSKCDQEKVATLQKKYII